MVSMICHCIGNTEDNVRGRQMPVHYTWKQGRFISISSPVGTQFSQAVGVAMASAYKGDDEVCISWLGDGTSAQGDYHYALNFASIPSSDSGLLIARSELIRESRIDVNE